MALLQIAEPGQSTKPHQRKYAVGIDLGTTHSLVATMRSGEPVTLADANGEHLLPSVVRYIKNAPSQVGYDALTYLVSDADNTIMSVKRLLGRGQEDIQGFGDTLPYQLDTSQPGMPNLLTAAGIKSPVEVSADILRVLVERGEASLGGTLEGAVITVPAYFDDAQRQATKDAARLAGIHVLRLLNEPTAAALAYGLDKQVGSLTDPKTELNQTDSQDGSSQSGIIAVYDLGGGTFDISILQLHQGVFEVMSIGGDSALGGDDFDRAIVQWICHTLSLDTITLRQQRFLLMQAKLAKETLSQQDTVTIDLNAWPNGVKDPLAETPTILTSSTLKLSRTQLDKLIEPLIDHTLKVTRKALLDASLSVNDVDEIILVGGSTRTLSVQKKLTHLFAKEPLTDLDPDRVVALGAARQADILVGNQTDNSALLLDVLPLSLGIETMGGLAERIIERNTAIPITRAQDFTTYQDGQTAMSIHVIQGERELVQDCRSLARFELQCIPPMNAGAAKIRVSFQVDADGLLEVHAHELTTNISTRIQIKPSYGLTETQITDMIKASINHVEDDRLQRSLAEQQVEAQRLLQSVHTALTEDSTQLLTEQESNIIQQHMQTLERVCTGNDPDIISQHIHILAKATENFAAKRMDLSVQQALKGQSVDNI